MPKLPEPEGKTTAEPKTKDEREREQDEAERKSKEIKGTNPVTGKPLEPGQDPPNLQSGTTYQAIASPEDQAAGEKPPPLPDPEKDPAAVPQRVEGADYRATRNLEMPPGPMVRQNPPYPNQPGTPPVPPEGARRGGDPKANPMNPPGYQPGGTTNQAGNPPIAGDAPIGQGADIEQTVGQPLRPQRPVPGGEPNAPAGAPQPGDIEADEQEGADDSRSGKPRRKS